MAHRLALTGPPARVNRALTDICAYLLALDAERERLEQLIAAQSPDDDPHVRAALSEKLKAIAADTELLRATLHALRSHTGVSGLLR